MEFRQFVGLALLVFGLGTFVFILVTESGQNRDVFIFACGVWSAILLGAKLLWP